MGKKNEEHIKKIQCKQPNILDKIIFFAARKFSNFFWKIFDLLSFKNKKISRFYEQSIGERYRKEFESFGISKDKKVLHIGCGSYPLTEITLTRLFGVKVVGIDKDPTAVQQAYEVVKRNHYDSKITIIHGDGVTHPTGTFDVIIISSCSLPKLKILEHVFHEAKKKSIIIVRELDIATKPIIDCIKKHKEIILIRKIHHSLPLFLPVGWDAFHLTKS
jgi:hypothetical protein